MDAHEIWAAAQLAPGEGIEDGVRRISALLGGGSWYTGCAGCVVDEEVIRLKSEVAHLRVELSNVKRIA